MLISWCFKKSITSEEKQFICQITFQISENYMMYEKCFFSKGEAFFLCVCEVHTISLQEAKWIISSAQRY